MLVLYYGDQRDAALAQYHACRRVLQEELGEEPSGETAALYERMRRGGINVPLPPPPPPSNLPVPPTALLGREMELAEVSRFLEDGSCRLLTLIGPGGIGKTRLALQAAADMLPDFEDGAFFVSLAPISDPRMVAPAIASALGVWETPDQPLLERLKARLRDRHMLLLLDNFEHLGSAGPLVAELLADSAQLRVLVTSRAVLNLRGEREYPLPPLALPDLRRDAANSEMLARYASVELFVQRARAAKPNFTLTPATGPVVAEICRRLDGLPLAIELAAARVKLMSPQALLARLERRLAVLTGGARDLPERQQTLLRAITWSYDLLEPNEKALFARFAVFAGDWTLEAAEEVCAPPDETQVDVLEGLASLADKSLLQRRDELAEGSVRFGMLETVREYALERWSRAGARRQCAGVMRCFTWRCPRQRSRSCPDPGRRSGSAASTRRLTTCALRCGGCRRAGRRSWGCGWRERCAGTGNCADA